MQQHLLAEVGKPETETTLSVLGQRLLMRPHAMQDALAISQQQGVPDLIGRILASRNVPVQQAETFLKPTLRECLPDPFHLKDMELASKRVAHAITHKEIIAIFGDYDVDGATSSALLIRYFRALGIKPLVHIPDRMKEGYGPNTPALESLKERGASLVITVDCGTMAFEPLAAARKMGLDVVVIDHHKGDATMPETCAHVNPNRFDERSSHTQLAAVGVAFLLLVGVNKVLREAGKETPDLMQWLDLVALGTICDVVPLTGANRALVTQGLKVMRTRSNTGMAAAMDAAQLSEAPGTYHAGFVIGPRINAGGRVGKADLGVRLLATDDPTEAQSIAQELNKFNAERKAIESFVQEEAMKEAAAIAESQNVIVVARAGWHPGVIGIVAGKLKDHFHKPTAVIAIADGIGKASARSVSGVDLGAAVVAATHEGLLIGGGGHAMAAGFTVEESKIPVLRDFLNQYLSNATSKLSKERSLYIDGIISLPGITTELVHLIEQAGPFGAGNPGVRLMTAKVRIIRADIVGETHVRVIAVDGEAGGQSQSLKAMAFRSVDTPLGQALLHSKGRTMHLVGQARINQWQGRESVDFFIDDAAYADN